MPFIALHKDTGERLNILDLPIEYLRSFPVGAIVCQLCESPMFPREAHERKTGSVRAHFVHTRRECSAQHPGYEGGNGERTEHLRGKQYLAEEWLPRYRRYEGATIEYERRIPESGQIADVLVTLPNGHRIAHEMQLAPISIEQLQERTNDYQTAGVDVYWHLGLAADAKPNRDYLASINCDFSVVSFRRSDDTGERQAA